MALRKELNVSRIYWDCTWVYLAVVMDFYPRRIGGSSIGWWSSRRLAINALNMAIQQRQPEGVLLHQSVIHVI